jgi:hypothetical protein
VVNWRVALATRSLKRVDLVATKSAAGRSSSEADRGAGSGGIMVTVVAVTRRVRPHNRF